MRLRHNQSLLASPAIVLLCAAACGPTGQADAVASDAEPAIQQVPSPDFTLGRENTHNRWSATIPYQLAYGEDGHPGGIPPKANLVFDMKLTKIGK